MRWAFCLLIWAPIALLALARNAQGQGEGGTITGRAVQAGSRQALGSVQVYLRGTSRGTLTSENGRFMLLNVAAGEYTIVAERIGYQSAARSVSVAVGMNQSVDFELQEEVLALDEIVVTGTAGQARRREVGNDVKQIDMRRLSEPVLRVDDVLQGQAAGINVLESGASSGGARQIRLRGNVSVTMSNEPLVYVDGVRVKSEPYHETDAPRIGARTGTVTNVLSSLNPNDIERIEVIKGPAATTLYGTEAAAGVIQIFTKRGTSERAQWAGEVDFGFKHLQAFGPDHKPKMGLDPWLKPGWSQRYALQVSGATGDTRYFLSGAFSDSEGLIITDWEKSLNVRGNVEFTAFEDLQLRWNTSITSRQLRNYPSGQAAEGLELNVYRMPRNYLGTSDPDVITDALESQQYLTDVGHVLSGITATYQPTADLSSRLTIGIDRSEVESTTTYPFGMITEPLGLRYGQRDLVQILTVDWVASLQRGLARELRSTLSAGWQSVNTEHRSISAFAREFAGPGEPTIGSGARTLGFEERERVINAGAFIQNLLGYRDRYFLTVGLRADGNSAFGQDLGLQLYPKVSASYVISDEPSWPRRFGSVKLRAAYGHAGRAPGAFDAVRTWQPSNYVGDAALVPSNLGNPELGPERTEELEVGVDGAFLGERLGVGFSYYRQKTTDALFSVLQAPSKGFLGSQLENVGALRNTGLELSVDAGLIETPGFRWNVGVQLATNHSEIEDLGGAAAFSLGGAAWIMEGQPAPVLVGTRVKNPDELADPELEAKHVFGPNLPTRTLGLNTSVGLPGGIEVSARGEYLGGHFILDRAARNMASRGVWAICQGPGGGYELLEQGRREEMTAFERLYCDRRKVPRDGPIFPADVFKIRTISVRVPIEFFPRVSSATFLASVRNLRLWTHPDLPMFDPEMAGPAGAASQVREIVEQIPAPISFAFSLRVTY